MCASDGAAAQAVGLIALPTTFVFDEAHQPVTLQTGQLTEERLRSAIEEAMA